VLAADAIPTTIQEGCDGEEEGDDELEDCDKGDSNNNNNDRNEEEEDQDNKEEEDANSLGIGFIRESEGSL
jgi:hypothetical protein